ncbi:MAG: glycosyltransferase family 87 protein [Anaerolineae bacterium]
MSSLSRYFLSTLFLLLTIVFVFTLNPERKELRGFGENDFRAYWGASYLLASNERFNSNDLLFNLQQRLTYPTTGNPIPQKGTALMTWNPPWILALFVPFTFFNFYDASFLWLLINIFFFVWSIEAIWALWPEQHKVSGRKIWLYASVLMFLPFWNTLILGQITPMLLFGLVGTIYFATTYPFIAGMCLTLLSAKPHLFLVTLPILLIDAFSKKNWRLIIGFVSALLALTSVSLWLRPNLFFDYLGDSGSPTQIAILQSVFLPFMMAYLVGWLPLRFLGVLIAPFSLIPWARIWRNFSSSNRVLHLAIITQLTSLFLAPYGFLFDLVLVLPIIWVTLLAIMPTSVSPKKQLTVVFGLIISSFSMLLIQASGLWLLNFTWFMPVILGFYLVAQPFKRGQHMPLEVGANDK